MTDTILYRQGVEVSNMRTEALSLATKVDERSTEIVLRAANLFLSFLMKDISLRRVEALSKAVYTSEYQAAPEAVVERAEAFLAFLNGE